MHAGQVLSQLTEQILLTLLEMYTVHTLNVFIQHKVTLIINMAETFGEAGN